MKQPKIEDGIPVPAPKGGQSSVYGELLRKLKVGQSFLVPKDKANAMHTTARFLFRESGHIATRVEGDFVRIWRIK